MIDMDSRLRVARGFGKSETDASIEVFKTLKERGHPDMPPPTVSNGWGGIDDAMVEVYGKIPEYSGRGRPPTHKQAQPGWQYMQIVKQKDEHGRFLGTDIRVIYGDETEVRVLFGESTAYIERTHLTMRHFNSRLTRKSLAFSKELNMHKAAAAWEDLYYNLGRPHKSLRINVADDLKQRWMLRTPAMTAGLTDHIWTVKELLTTKPLPNGNT